MMGKLFKIALGLAIVGVGMIALFGVLSQNDVFAIVNEGDFVYNELVYDADEFTDLNFTFENRDFIIRPSVDDSIRIEYYTTERDTVTVSEDNQVLTLENDVEWYNQFFLGFSFLVDDDFYDVYLYLPTSEIYDLDIITSNGTADFDSLSNLRYIHFRTSNGRITINDSDFTTLDLATSNGGIWLTDVSVTGALQTDTTNGKINLDTVSASDISGHTSNGEIILNSINSDSVDLDTSNGAITATNLTSIDVRLESTNGDIDVSVIGDKDDYEVTMSTSNGDLNYDGIEVSQEHFNSDGIYEIELHSSNGDVTIDFITSE